MPRLETKADPKIEMFDKGGVGKKYCPNCKKFFKGPTRKNCPKCGTAIPGKDSQKRSAAKRTSTVDGFAVVKSAITFAKARGGVDAAKADLSELEAFLEATGGIKQAIAALDQIKELEALNGK